MTGYGPPGPWGPGGSYPLLVPAFEEHDVDGGTIVAQADAVVAKAGDIENFNADLTTQHNHAESGVAGILTDILSGADDPTKNVGRQLIQKLVAGGGAIRAFGDDVTTFGYLVDRLNTQLRSVETREEQQEKRSALSGQYQAGVETLETAAGTAKSRLENPLDTQTIKDLYAAGALPSTTASIFGLQPSDLPDPTKLPTDIEAMSVSERADYVLDREDIDEALLGLILANTAVSNQVGRRISAEAQGVTKDTSPEDLRRVTDLMNRFVDNPSVAVAFVRDMPADRLVQLISLGAEMSFGSAQQGGYDFSTALRDTFRAGEGELSDQETRAYARDLVGYFRSVYIDHDQDGSGNGNDPVSLSFLLRDSDLSTSFLDTMGDELEHFEQSLDRTDAWRTMSATHLGGSGLFGEDAHESAFDPFSSYMTALGRNEEAALQFFTAGGENPHDTEAGDRQEYFIERRKWGHDDFNGLLSALDAATTGDSNLADPDSRRDAAALTAAAVEMLANRTEDGDRSDGEKFAPGDLGGPGARHLANIFGNYMAAVDYYNMNPSNGEGSTAALYRVDGSRLEDMPVLDIEDVKKLLQAGLANEDGFSAFRSAVSAYQDANLGSLVREHHGSADFEEIFSKATNADARLEGLFLDLVGEQEIADGKSKDEQREAWVDLGEDAVGLIPVGSIPVAGPVAGFITDQAVGAGADALRDSLMHYESDARNTANDMASTALWSRTNSITSQLYDLGVITPEQVQQRDPALYERYFGEGRFPTAEQIGGDQGLQNLVSALAADTVDMNEYRQNYENAFRDYFEE